MQRIGTDDGLFVNGNPATSTLGTVVTADFLNAVQEEIAGVIEEAGVELDPENQQQLAAIVTPITHTTDPTFASDSIRPASTGWVRRAMSAIAIASGFSVTLAQNGQIKFPSWLGGVIFQWGFVEWTTGTTKAFSWVYPFPNQCFAGFASDSSTFQSGLGIDPTVSGGTLYGSTSPGAAYVLGIGY